MTTTLAQSGSGWLGSATSTQSPASRPKMCLACAPSWSPWNNPRWSVRQADLLGVSYYIIPLSLHITQYPTHLLMSHHRLNSEDECPLFCISVCLTVHWKDILVLPSSESSRRDCTVGVNPEAPAQYVLPLNGFHSQASLGIPFSDVSFGSFKGRSWLMEILKPVYRAVSWDT